MSEIERTSEQIAKNLAEFKKMVEEVKLSIEPFLDEQREIKAEITDHRKEIDRLTQLSFEIDVKTKHASNKVKEIGFDIARAEREYGKAVQREAIRLEFEEAKAEYDRIVAGAPWREWALDHQIGGAMRLAAAKKAILGDKPGLGKTLTSLIYADMVGAKKIVVVLPKDTMSNFKREVEHWAPHRAALPVGGEKRSTRQMVLNMMKTLPSFIALFNYDAWRRDADMLEDIIALKADTIIIDEAHNMKKFSTLRARGVRTIVHAANACPKCGGDAKVSEVIAGSWRTTYECVDCHHQGTDAYEFCSIKNVLPMTGTPIINRPMDLFPMLNLIDPMTYPTEKQFRDDYCWKNYNGRWEFKYGGQEQLIRQLQTQFLVRTRKDAGIVLPPQEVQYHTIPFDAAKYPKQAEVLRNLNHFAQVVVGEDQAVGILYIIELILRKRQAIVWPDGIKFYHPKTREILYQVDVHESIKVDKVIEWDQESEEWSGLIPDLAGWDAEFSAADMLEQGERIVLFSQFITPLSEIWRRCNEAGISAVMFTGDTPKHIAEDVKIDIDRNYAHKDGRKPKYQVVLAHYKKGGEGLNMTDITQMILLDNPWSPGGEEQTFGRTDRMGQTKETTVHVIEVESSIDTWMRSLIEEKRDMIQGFESEQQMAQALMDAIRNGEIL